MIPALIAAAVIGGLALVKQLSEGRSSYEDGLRDGESTAKEAAEREKLEAARIRKIVRSENRRPTRRVKLAVEEPEDESAADTKPKTKTKPKASP